MKCLEAINQVVCVHVNLLLKATTLKILKICIHSKRFLLLILISIDSLCKNIHSYFYSATWAYLTILMIIDRLYSAKRVKANLNVLAELMWFLLWLISAYFFFSTFCVKKKQKFVINIIRPLINLLT